MRSQIESIILAFIKDDLLTAGSEEIQTDCNLFAEGYLDSIGIMRLIAHLETELNTKIPPKDLVPKNFMTIQAMATYLTTESSNNP